MRHRPWRCELVCFIGWCALRVFGRSAQVLGALPVAVVLRLLRALVQPSRKPERELHKAFFSEAELASCKTLAICLVQ